MGDDQLRILVCGSRHWSDSEPIRAFLDAGLRACGSLVIIEGAAPGADTFAERWAQARILWDWLQGNVPTVDLERYPAKWDEYGKAAGPIRNRQMLVEGKPDMVIGFSEDIEKSRGTANMLAQAEKAGVMTVLHGI